MWSDSSQVLPMPAIFERTQSLLVSDNFVEFCQRHRAGGAGSTSIDPPPCTGIVELLELGDGQAAPRAGQRRVETGHIAIGGQQNDDVAPLTQDPVGDV